jgi:hypothetical protein
MARFYGENMREGFWKQDKNDSKLPWPSGGQTPWRGRAKFLQELAIKEGQAKKLRTKGFSLCRICKEANGSITFQLNGWIWPSGYRHYIEAHNVRPSLAFQEWVLGETLT